MQAQFRGVAALAMVALPMLGASSAEGGTFGHRPLAAAAACKQWNVKGTWKVVQSNGAETFYLKQHGQKLSGDAVTSPQTAAEVGYTTGRIAGTVKGDHVTIYVYWQTTASEPKALGGYYGTVSTHRMSGRGNNLDNEPSVYETWYAPGHARCVQR